MRPECRVNHVTGMHLSWKLWPGTESNHRHADFQDEGEPGSARVSQRSRTRFRGADRTALSDRAYTEPNRPNFALDRHRKACGSGSWGQLDRTRAERRTEPLEFSAGPSGPAWYVLQYQYQACGVWRHTLHSVRDTVISAQGRRKVLQYRQQGWHPGSACAPAGATAGGAQRGQTTCGHERARLGTASPQG